MLTFMTTISRAQCDYNVKTTQKVNGETGSITLKLTNTENYMYKLYAYEGGEKVVIEKNSGNSKELVFDGLSINRYYRIEFTFGDTENFLCASWVTELINFND